MTFKLDNITEISLVQRAAMAMYRMINLKDVDDELLADASIFFAHSESPVAPALFHDWFHKLSKSLHQQPALMALADSWKARMSAGTPTTPAKAEEFLREFSAAIRLDKLDIQTVVCGYSQRRAGGPFDTELSQSTQPQCWTLLYSTEGNAHLRTGIRETVLSPGQALLTSPDAYYSLSRDKHSEHWSHYWLAFLPPSTWRRYLVWPAIGPDTYLMTVPKESQPVIQSAVESLLQASSHPSTFKAELESNLMEQVLIRFAELLDIKSTSALDSRVIKAQQYIADHYNQEFTLQQVADFAHVSISRLTNLFKAQTGLSMFKWRDEKRLMEAAQLLRSSDFSVAQIGQRVGFQDAAYFSRIFRQYLGCSPRAYRQGE